MAEKEGSLLEHIINNVSQKNPGKDSIMIFLGTNNLNIGVKAVGYDENTSDEQTDNCTLAFEAAVLRYYFTSAEAAYSNLPVLPEECAQVLEGLFRRMIIKYWSQKGYYSEYLIKGTIWKGDGNIKIKIIIEASGAILASTIKAFATEALNQINQGADKK